MTSEMTDDTQQWLKWIESEWRLSPSARRVAAHFAQTVGVGGSITAAPGDLAPRVGISAGSVRIALRQLKRCGMLAVRLGGGRSYKNTYLLTL